MNKEILNMNGEFELKTTVERKLKPDTITLQASIVIVEKDKKEVKDKAYKELDRINKKVSGLGIETKVIYTNNTFTEVKDTFSKSTILGSKDVTTTSIRGTFDLSVVISSVKYEDDFKDKLSQIVEIINESEYLSYLTYSTKLSNEDSIKMELKSEVGKKCREEANCIINGLGFKIIGVKKVLYNTSGYLFNNDNTSVKYSAFDEDECCDFGMDCIADFNSFEESKSFASNVVEGIMQEEITISDSITVLFLVGE